MSAGFWVDQTRQRHALRDHSDASTLDTRAGVRVHVTTDVDDGLLNGTIEGDSFLEGAFYLAGEEEKEEGKSWGGGFIIAGGELENGTRFAPYRTTQLDTDERYRVVDILGAEDFLPFTIDQFTAVASDHARPMKSPVSDTIEAQAAHRPMLDGHPEMLIAGTEERRQHLIAVAPWAGILVAQDRGAEAPKYSTAIVDASGSEIDRDLVTGMDSLCQVAIMRGSERGAARRYDRPNSGGGFGLFYEQPGVYGFDSKQFGGPMGAGAGAADKHLKYVGKNGDAFVGGHVHLIAPHYLTPVKDDPLDAELAEWSGIDPRGVDVHVHMRHSVAAQRWRWMVRVPAIISPPPRRPPPPMQPPLDPPKPPPPPPPPPPPVPPPVPPPPPKPPIPIPLPGGLLRPDGGPPPLDPDDPLSFPDPGEPDPITDPEPGPGVEGGEVPAGPDDDDDDDEDFGRDPVFIIGDQLRGPQGLIPNPFTGFDEPEPEDVPLPTEPNTDGTCRVHAFWNKLGAPTFVGQPTPVRAHNKDFRRNDTPSPEEAREATHDRPVGWHLDFVGAEDSGGDWAYTQRPEDDDRLYEGGSVPCVGWVLPVEVRGRDAAEATTQDALEDEFGPLSDTGIGLGAGARIYYGLPNIANGLGRLGFSTGLFSSTQLNTDCHDATGARTVVTTLTSAGVFGAASFADTGASNLNAPILRGPVGQAAKNTTAGTLTAPMVVRETGYAASDVAVEIDVISATSQKAAGILLVSVAAGVVGKIAVSGPTVAAGLDTSAATIGDSVYSDAAGAITLTPGGPRVGRVLLKANPGTIYVDIAQMDIGQAGAMLGIAGATPVAIDTGWSITNPTTRRTFDVAAATLAELREFVGTLAQKMGLDVGLIKA